ncbi:MAG: hypothetical protein K1X88_02115 [Nannocystaceae bacterium]|nr:hypothetical protein [Nannocystaceae bacterium]
MDEALRYIDHGRIVVGLGALSLGLVAVGPLRAEPGATIDRVVVPARAVDDFAAAPRATAARRAVLYVNFDGAALSYGLDDSHANITAIEERAGQFPDYGGTSQRAAVLQAVAADFDGYDVVIVDERPDGGDYTMAMVGPAGEKGVLGVALLDCNDDSPNNIVFAYHSDGDGYSAASQANTISQEVAHSFGLEHVDHPGDIMYPQSTGGDPVFLDACLPIVPPDDIVCTAQHRRHCDPGYQNAFRELYELLGPSRSDDEPPVVYLSAPADGAELPAAEPFEITARAFDDHAIGNVVLFVDDVNVGSDMVAPYTWPISGQQEGIVEVYAIAVDEAGNMARSDTIELYVGIENPDADHHRGCAVAAPRALSAWAAMLALLGLRRRRR